MSTFRAVTVLALASGCATSLPMPPLASPPIAVDQIRDRVHINPYHAVVKRKVLASFRGLTAHDPGPALALMATDVRYTFEGEHALGGTRVSRAGVQKWFTRLLRLLPGQFAIREVRVTGWPWSTRVVTRFEHHVVPPEGPAYWGPGVQIVDLRWGKATQIHTYVDTAKLVETLTAMAAAGQAEAMAPPILE